MDKIKLRQICFLFAALMPVTKMIIYPATLCFYAKNDLLFSAAANFLLEGAVLALVILLAYRTDLTFFDLLKNTFGQAAARILYGLFALFFALSALLPILEQKGFVMQIFYENIPSLISFAPFFGVCIFACVKGFKTIGRAADIALPVFAVCFTVILLLSLPQADFSALLPVGGTGADGIFRGSLYGLNWYTDCLYPLFFLGHFEREKGAWWKIGLSFLAGAAAVLLFLGTFYGIFADIAVRQQNTLAQISKYTTSFTTLGRIDLLFIFALALVLVFALCVPLQMSVHCLCKAFGGCRPLLPAAAVNLLFLVFTIFFNYSYHRLQSFFTQNLWAVFAIFAYALPALALLLRKRPRGVPPPENGAAANLEKSDKNCEKKRKKAENSDKIAEKRSFSGENNTGAAHNESKGGAPAESAVSARGQDKPCGAERDESEMQAGARNAGGEENKHE